eukprot:IDg3348t1
MINITQELDEDTEDDDLTAYVTFPSSGIVSSYAAELLESSTEHTITKKIPTSEPTRYDDQKFYGIAIDTCCANASTGGTDQYMAYCKYTGTDPNIQKNNGKGVKFGIGRTKSLGIAKCNIPIGNLVLQFNLHIVDADRLHRRFGHPSVNKLINVLKRAEPDKIDESTRAALNRIVNYCKLCQYHAQKPRRFKFTIRSEKGFNQQVVLDRCYLGPPDIIVHDAAKTLLSKSFQTNTGLLQITTKPVPIEAANSMTYVERYHAPLRRAFKIIKEEAPDIDDEAALQFAVKSVNDSAGPDGIVPTLLVYGALPRLGFQTDKPTPSMYQRARAVHKATKSMSQYFAKRQVQDALRNRNGPDISDIHKLPIGSHVLVYRIHKCRWE